MNIIMKFSSVKLFFLFQIAVISLMALDLLPREFSFILTAMFLGYIIISSTWEGLLIAIISIPLYIALPVSASMDSLANWRVVILAVFAKWLIERAAKMNRQEMITQIKNLKISLGRLNKMETLGMIFLLIAAVSLAGAFSVGVGAKKIIFLANIFLLYFLIRKTADTSEKIGTIIKISVFPIGIVLFAGYLQLFLVFFISLFDFWQYWAANVISIFYGENLGRLLSVSNTWFSYYGEGVPPTLRIFSMFPDSHSFALFNIISIPFLLALAAYFKGVMDLKKYRLTVSFIFLALFAIILSGSRGAWVGAILPLGIIVAMLIIARFRILETIRAMLVRISHVKTMFLKFKKVVLVPRVIPLTLVLFFLLFPVSSLVLNESQKAEFDRLNNKSGKKYEQLSFKRFASVIDVTETSNKGRIEIWKDTLNSIKKHPVLGVGFGNFPIVLQQDVSSSKKGASAHNIYLDIWAETGLPGLVVFLLIFYEIGRTAFGVFRNSRDKMFKIFGAAFGIYLIWVMGYGMFDVVLFNDKVLMLFMVAVGILYAMQNVNIKMKNDNAKL